MNTCVQCGKETNSTYIAKEFKGILCPKHLKFYFGKELLEINQKIRKLEQRKNEINEIIKQAELTDCKHENKTYTGFMRKINGRMFKEYICNDCNSPVLIEKEM